MGGNEAFLLRERSVRWEMMGQGRKVADRLYD